MDGTRAGLRCVRRAGQWPEPRRDDSGLYPPFHERPVTVAWDGDVTSWTWVSDSASRHWPNPRRKERIRHTSQEAPASTPLSRCGVRRFRPLRRLPELSRAASLSRVSNAESRVHSQMLATEAPLDPGVGAAAKLSWGSAWEPSCAGR